MMKRQVSTGSNKDGNNRMPLKDSINNNNNSINSKKSISGKHSSSLNVKETPTYSKKKVITSETPKLGSSNGIANVKKLFRCNSQKTQKYTSSSGNNDDFVSSPLMTTYK
jgi:hypothetical protein